MTINRRVLLRGLGGATLAGGLSTLGGLGGCASAGVPSRARVVVVGGGFGGATAAKYVRLLSDYRLDVVLVEPNEAFISCPISNLVLGGNRQLAEITVPYTALERRHGVRHVRDSVARIDPKARKVVLASGPEIGYDKLIVSPGIDLNLDAIHGLRAAQASGAVLQAWKAGAETTALRRQLESLPDGGVYALTVPEAPYRCPPGPYERASVIAAYFKAAKPRAKVLVLDANPDVTSKGVLFKKVWSEQYAGILEYRPNHKVTVVDAASRRLRFELHDDLKADVLNVLPMMRAGALAVQTGLANANARWCHVNFLNFESTAAKDIHVLGDAIQVAQGMPKSGHMANSHAKVTAAALVAELSDMTVNPHPMLTNVCLSYVDDSHVIHVASVHEYVPTQKTFRTIGGSGGVSDVRSDLEAAYAQAWARNIWADVLM